MLKLDVVRKNERYKDFTYLEKPIPFQELYKNKELPLVQVHDIEWEQGMKGFAGFCGSFSWKDGVITPEDHDTYNENMLVYGYHEFETQDEERGLDILTDHDW